MSSPISAMLLSIVALCAVSPQTSAYEIYSDSAGTHLNADLLAVYGLFDSKRNYIGESGGRHWREGFAKYGLSGSTDRLGAGSLYGAFSLVSSGTWGDGDPGGYTTGDERHTSVEEAYLGWKSGSLFPALGQDGVDFSVGRQAVKVGRGFLIMDDGFNPGKGLENGSLNRGGAYYLGARHSFGNTAVLRLGGAEGLHGSAMWLKSNNRAQAKTELAAGTLDYTASAGTIGLTYIRGLDVDARYASPSQLERKNMNVYSIRGEGDAGIKNAQFAFEYAEQHKNSGTNTAWYGQAGHTFTNLAWRPTVSYRYSRYSKNWDLLFTGGYREWLQGEVASNYANSYANNLQVHNISFSAQPRENLTIGAMFYDFRTLANRSALKLDARELDLYLEWAVTDNIMISPLIGLYKPSKYQANGGNQSRNASTNVYSQLLVVMTF
jgi:hypothetical protein